MKKDLDLCLYYGPSRSQRKTEEDRGDGQKGTKTYENAGCYSCDGLNEGCPYFVNQSKLEEEAAKYLAKNKQ